MKERIEKDTLGAVKIPGSAYWGKETQRALGVFQVSGEPMPLGIIRQAARIKRHAALVNAELKLLSRRKAAAIARAAQEVEIGKWDRQFLIDLYQSGSGTNSHGNVNEVIANRARCARLAAANPMLVTALTPKIGYDRAAEIAKRALKEGRTVAEVAAEMTDISVQELKDLLDPKRMT